MPGYFFDSSALAKHYHVEVGTAEVDRILQLPDARHFIARLALVEIRSVFARKVRTGVITEDDFRLLCHHFFADVTTRRLQVVRLTNASYRAAGRLIEQHATHYQDPVSGRSVSLFNPRTPKWSCHFML